MNFVWGGGTKKSHRTTDPALPGVSGTFEAFCGETVEGTIEKEPPTEVCSRCDQGETGKK